LHCRYVSDHGSDTWAKLGQLVEEYRCKTIRKDSAGNEVNIDPLITEDTLAAHRQQRRLLVDLNGIQGALHALDQARHSAHVGERGSFFCADPLPLEDMYYKDINGKWACKRGTSHVENWNGRLGDVLNGNNYSADTAQILLTVFVARANVRADARVPGRSTFYGSYNLPLLQRANSGMVAAGFAAPYPNLPKVLVGEFAFGYDWRANPMDTQNSREPRPMPAELATPLGKIGFLPPSRNVVKRRNANTCDCHAGSSSLLAQHPTARQVLESTTAAAVGRYMFQLLIAMAIA
jgi:hypothetical protein